MKIKYTVEIEDLIAFNEHHMDHSPMFRQSKKNAIIYTPLSLFLLFLVIGIGEHAWTLSIIGIIASLILAVLAPLTFRKHVRKTLEKSMSEGRNKGAVGQQQLELRDDGIYNTNSAGTQSTYWNAVERIEQTETHGFIYISSMSAHVIPALKVKEGDFDAFMQAARDHLPCTSTPAQGSANDRPKDRA